MKRILAICLALMLTLSLAACGGEQPNGTTTAATNAGTKAPLALDMPTVYQKFQQAVVLPEMLELNESLMLDFCGIQATDVKQAIVVVCADSLRADEIWLVEAVDEAAAQRIEDLAHGRLDQKDAESITYSPEQNAIVKQAELIREGNYIIMIVSPDVQALAQVIRAEMQ